jgi:diguanylate cyclase (GGDEF)-like protein
MDAIAASIADSVVSSDNAYKATHVPLTGLVNKHRFAELLAASIAGVSGTVLKPSDPSVTLASPHLVSVLAIDIDHFKQVNDSYGHEYGDDVLRALAVRLTTTIDAISHEYTDLFFEVGHLSGEEFAISVRGPSTPDDVVRIANVIRQAISDRPLPSTAEFRTIGSEVPADNVPREAERHISISVGVATGVIGARDERSSVLASRLAQQADAAMFRAKNSGRNCVRRYDDILLKLGRVLEHHEVTGQVAIDIGSNVGVSVGQEFLVYDPNFAGDVPFVYSDGRTTKTLGAYPKVPYAKIVAANVQPALTFCSISDPSPDMRTISISKGSNLEAIPLGTISRSLSAPDIFETSPSLFGTAQLQQFATEVQEAGRLPGAFVFALRDIDQVLAERGHVAINTALARLYDVLTTLFPATARIGKTQTTEFAVVLASSGSSIALGESVAERFAGIARNTVRLSIGYFDADVYKSKLGGYAKYDKSDFKPAASVELARYAAAAARQADTVEVFSAAVALELIAASRQARRFVSLISDLERLTSLGLINAAVLGQGAIAAAVLTPPDVTRAVHYADSAKVIAPDDPVLYGISAWVQESFKNDEGARSDLTAAFARGLDVTQDYAYATLLSRLLFRKPEFVRSVPREQVDKMFAEIRQAAPADSPGVIALRRLEQQIAEVEATADVEQGDAPATGPVVDSEAD